jgi:hypothetical protein
MLVFGIIMDSVIEFFLKPCPMRNFGSIVNKDGGKYLTPSLESLMVFALLGKFFLICDYIYSVFHTVYRPLGK